MARERPTRQQLSLMVHHRGLKALLEEQPAFRKFIFTLFTDAGIFVPTYSHSSPYDTAFNAGRQSMGLEVLHMLKHVRPDILGLIEKEGNLLEVEVSAATTPHESEELYDSLSTDDADER